LLLLDVGATAKHYFSPKAAFEEMRGSRKYFQIIGMIQNGTKLPRNAA
jgi:hypothetical protein